MVIELKLEDDLVIVDGIKYRKEVPVVSESNNYKIHCLKSWKGCIDIKEFTAKAAILNNQNIEVTCKNFPGEVMTLTPKDLKDNIVSVSKEFVDRFGNQGVYRLLSYKWNGQIKGGN